MSDVLTVQVNLLVVLKVIMFVFPCCRVLMTDISEDMASEDLNSVKFLLSTTLPREKMDKVKVNKINEVWFCFHYVMSHFSPVWEGNFGVMSSDTKNFFLCIPQ